MIYKRLRRFLLIVTARGATRNSRWFQVYLLRSEEGRSCGAEVTAEHSSVTQGGTMGKDREI